MHVKQGNRLQHGAQTIHTAFPAARCAPRASLDAATLCHRPTIARRCTVVCVCAHEDHPAAAPSSSPGGLHSCRLQPTSRIVHSSSRCIAHSPLPSHPTLHPCSHPATPSVGRKRRSRLEKDSDAKMQELKLIQGAALKAQCVLLLSHSLGRGPAGLMRLFVAVWCGSWYSLLALLVSGGRSRVGFQLKKP